MNITDSPEQISEKLRAFEVSMEQLLDVKDWQAMETINQELQQYCHALEQSGLLQHASVQQSLARVHVLFEALIQVCTRHRSASLEALQQTKHREQVVRRYQTASEYRER